MCLAGTIATWAQNATDNPAGLFKITNIKSDSIEIDLSAAAVNQYLLCGDAACTRLAIGANGIFAIAPEELPSYNDTVAQGEFDTRISNYNGASFEKHIYNTGSSSQIFPTNSWIVETWRVNCATSDGFNIIKCLKTKEEKENSLSGIWEYDNGNNETYYRAYSGTHYVTIAQTAENKYMGELTQIDKTTEKGFYKTKKDGMTYRTEFTDENTMLLTCTTQQGSDVMQWKRSTLPELIENAIKHIEYTTLTDTEGIIWENENIVMPEFPGGKEQLLNYLKKNIKYPKDCVKSKIEGKAFVKFIVETDGTIESNTIEIVKSSGDFRLDKEAIRVVDFMPKWQPGTLNGKPIRAKFTLPIIFRLK